MHSLSCTDLARRLAESIDLLDDDAGPARHRSVRVVLDESWRGLDERLRAPACRLSVFDGAFDVDAAQSIAQAGALDLTWLAEQCWLARAGGDRFAMHALVRRYAREQARNDEAGTHSLRLVHARPTCSAMRDRPPPWCRTPLREYSRAPTPTSTSCAPRSHGPMHCLLAPMRYARARRRIGAEAFCQRARHIIDSICYVGELSSIGGEARKSLALCLRGLALLPRAGACAEGACLAGAAA